VRIKTTKTRFSGVYSADERPGFYRVWGQTEDKKTGLKLTLDKIIEARSPLDANRQRTELLAKLDVREQEKTRKRLSDYVESWLRTKLPKVKASTASLYATVIDEHILPVLGDFYLDAITRDDVLDWRDAMSAKQLLDPVGRPVFNVDGTPRLPQPVTVNGRYRVLKTLLLDAVVDEKLDRDPTSRVSAIRENTATGEDTDEGGGKSITAAELASLLTQAQAATPGWYPFFFVLAFTGLRFGEITALKWRDLDEDAGKLWVRRAQWKGIVDTVKNNKPRTVPLMPELLAVFEQHRAAQHAAMTKRLKRQRVPDLASANPGDWIFPSRQPGKLLHSTAPRKPLALATSKAGVEPGFTIHGFRHTFNNLVRQVAELNGQTIVLQAMTGHSSDQMTEHYSQVGIEEKRRAVGGLLRLVQGGAP
jgi:integrase